MPPRTTYKTALSAALRTLFVLSLLSCKGTDSTDPGSDDPVVGSVAVTLSQAVLHIGDSAQATATVLSTSSSVISGKPVLWSTDNSAVAVVSTSGRVKAVGLGTAQIQASADGKLGMATFRVVIVPVASIAMLPDTASVVVGQALVLSAILKDSAGNALSGRDVSWISTDPTKATVTGTGVVTGLAAGTVTISATAEGKSTTARITILPVVSNSPVANVSISLPRSSFRVGETIQAAAIPVDANGSVLTGRRVVWSTDNSTIATVDESGLVSGVNVGVTTISAEVEGKTGVITIQLSLIPVATVAVTPSTETISAGATVPFAVILKDSANRTLTGRQVAWSSSAPTIASVSEAGVVTGILVGSTEITATSEGKQGKASVNVNTLATPVATISLSPSIADISGGGTKQLVATLRDTNGNVLGGRTIAWSSSNADRATVSLNGLVTAAPVDAPVTITASVEGMTASTTLTVVTLVRMSGPCGLTADGTAYCWSAGKLPQKIQTNVKFAAISSGPFGETCGLQVDTGFAYCFSANVVTAIPVVVPGNYRFVSIAVGMGTRCGTTAERDVYCWGTIRYEWDDGFGGNGRSDNVGTPILVAKERVAVVAGADNQFCSVDQGGLGYCSRIVFYTGLTGTTSGPFGSAISSTLRFTSIRMGYGHACGLTETGQAYCWGNNDRGQLGNGTTGSSFTPVPVSGGLIFESIAAAGWGKIDEQAVTIRPFGVSCGVTKEGKAYCWGANDYGELGIGTISTGSLTPQTVVGGIVFTGLRGTSTNFTESICGLAVGGNAYCWGAINGKSQPTQLFGN